MRLPVFSLAVLVETSPLKGVGLPGVNQSEAGPHSGEGDWEAGPSTKVTLLGFALLGFRVFGQPGGRRSGLCPTDAKQS